MGTITYTYTITGAESIPGVMYFAAIPNWTGAFTIGIHLSTPATTTVNLGWGLYKASGPTSCFGTSISFLAGQSDQGQSWNVGSPSFQWLCGDWDSWNLTYGGATGRLPTGCVLTITFDGPGITGSLGVCAYGSESIDPGIKVVDLIPTAIAIIRKDTNKWWALAGLLNAVAKPILLDFFCSQPPPPDEDLEWTDWLDIPLPFHETRWGRKFRIKAEREIWSQYCHCKAATGGGPPPVGPGPTNWVQPTFYITNDHRTFSNYDISTTLQWIYNFQLTNQYTTNNTFNNAGDQYTTISNTNTTVNQLAAASTCPPAAYVEGTVHPALSGAGRIAIDQVVGFKVEVLEHDTSKPVLTGDPPYLWDVGWVSILGIGDELVDEKRVTREAYLWFPCAIMHATHFAYRLRDASVCRVTELVVPGGGLEPP